MSQHDLSAEKKAALSATEGGSREKTNLFIHLVGVALLGCVVLSLHSASLMIPYDGSYRKELIKYNFQWTHPHVGSSLNPLQALGGLAFPINFWFSPSAMINHLAYGSEVAPVLIYLVIGIELFLAVWWLGKCLELAQGVRLGAAWLMVILSLPFLLPLNGDRLYCFYSLSSIVPDVLECMAAVGLIVGLIMQVRLSAFPKAWRHGVAISALLAWLSIEVPVEEMLFLPLVAVFSLYWLVLQISGLKDVGRVVLLGLIMFLPTGVACVSLLGTLLDCPAVFFPRDFAPDRPSWIFISLLFHGPNHIGWMSTLIFLLGWTGAVVAIATKTGPVRKTAIFYLLYSAGLVAAGLTFTFLLPRYRVPSSSYYEWFIWPLMFLYAAVALQSAGRFFLKRVGPGPLALGSLWSLGIERRDFSRAFIFCAGCALGLAVTGWSVALFDHAQQKPDDLGLPFPPLKSPFAQDLAQRVGLEPGTAWKGCVATMTECDGPNPSAAGSTWPAQSAWDDQLWRKTGSEYRAMCLWWLNIPTLFAYSSITSPDYYYLMTRLFAVPADAQVRSVLVLTHPDIRFLGLFGVKVLVTDKPMAADPRLKELVNPPPPQGLFAYDVERANTAGISALRVTRCPSAPATLSRMLSPDFDPFSEAIIYGDVPPALTAASHSEMIWNKDRVTVRAEAPGWCLLVLPLQYSHCVKLKSKGKDLTPVRLVRADLTLCGLLFSKELNVTLSSNYGPFKNVLGKFEDYRELKGLQLGQTK